MIKMQKNPTRLINQNLWSTKLVNFFHVIPCFFFLFIAKKQFLRNTLVCCNILMTLFIIDVINVIKKTLVTCAIELTCQTRYTGIHYMLW